MRKIKKMKRKNKNMKKHIKEIIVLIIQTFMFYIFPLFAGPTDVMGMVLIILLSTLILSIIIANISKQKIKYLYPIIISILFTPSVFIYYNTSALIHILWHMEISFIGIVVGTIIHKIAQKNNYKEREK